MRLPLAAALLLALPVSALAQSQASRAAPGLTLMGGFGGGAEAGLSGGKAGFGEAELLAGWELEPPGLRPELAVGLGFSPDKYVSLRPGLSLLLRGVPIWLRTAVDLSTARGESMRFRWLIFGLGWEVRATSQLSFGFEFDTGLPLSNTSGVPLGARAMAIIRP